MKLFQNFSSAVAWKVELGDRRNRACALDQPFKLPDDFLVLRGDIICLTGILREIVEFERRMWADLNKLYGSSTQRQPDDAPARTSGAVKEVFQYSAMDETVPLDLWRHATSKGAGFELVLARKGKEVHLGVFNWSDTPKEYALAAFGKLDPVKLAARHSIIMKYDGKNSFAQLCQKQQSR